LPRNDYHSTCWCITNKIIMQKLKQHVYQRAGFCFVESTREGGRDCRILRFALRNSLNEDSK
jgi:hypothetical protein